MLAIMQGCSDTSFASDYLYYTGFCLPRTHITFMFKVKGRTKSIGLLDSFTPCLFLPHSWYMSFFYSIFTAVVDSLFM